MVLDAIFSICKIGSSVTEIEVAATQQANNLRFNGNYAEEIIIHIQHINYIRIRNNHELSKL